MMSMHVSELRHLRAATAYKGRAGSNACVQWSTALALDLRPGVLTFGTLRAATHAEIEQGIAPSNASLVPFIHCWVEVGDFVLAPTTIERTGGMLVPMLRASYYEVNGVSDARRVSRDSFDRIARRHRLVSALKHGSPRFGSKAVAGELLDAAGVRYRLGESNALLPINFGATA